MVDGVVPDIQVGRVTDGPLETRISVRGGNIVMQYVKGARGWEVVYSVKSATLLLDVLMQAIGTASGRG